MMPDSRVEQSDWAAEEIQAAKVQGFELTTATMEPHHDRHMSSGHGAR